MAWKEIVKQVRGGSCYGPKWESVPAVAINKQGVSLNTLFAETFLGGRVAVCFVIDEERKLLGIKVPGTQDLLGAFKVSIKSGSKNTRSVSVRDVPKTFPEAIGHAYRARMNPGERIIEVELSSENRI